MDRVDEVLLKVLNSRPKTINDLIEETGLSRAAVFKHLSHLRELVSDEPILKGQKGRPRLSYRILKPLSSLPTADLVFLPFTRLRHACRFEKGNWCKERKKMCSPQICPLLTKKK
mgnify:CR=1 FL=1